MAAAVRIALQPVKDVVVIALPVPQHSGQSLTLHLTCIFIGQAGVDSSVKFIGLADPIGENLLESGERVCGSLTKSHAYTYRRASLPRKVEAIERCRLCAPLFGVDGILGSADYIIVKCVLKVPWDFAASEHTANVGFVLAKKKSLRRVEIKLEGAECRMDRLQMRTTHL